jgi:16S rRNA (uracil1498-N3)-methyltransferase
VDGDAVEFSLHEEVEGGESLPLIVGLSIVRFERMEWAIEKLTELGVARMIPLITRRSEKHLVQAAAKRSERWRKISREAAQQSRRSQVPEISDPMSVKDCIGESQHALRFILSEEERVRSLWESLMTTDRDAAPSKEIYTAIGPEGGWTPEELASWMESGWQSVSLGSNILRTETAAIGAWWNG